MSTTTQTQTDNWTYTITEPRKVQQTWETASNYTEFTLLPGVYEVEFVNIDYTPWNSDPEAITPGFIKNIGPYYALVRVAATKDRSFYVNRVFTATSAHDEDHGSKPATHTISVYAYQVKESDTADGFHRA